MRHQIGLGAKGEIAVSRKFVDGMIAETASGTENVAVSGTVSYFSTPFSLGT